MRSREREQREEGRNTEKGDEKKWEKRSRGR